MSRSLLSSTKWVKLALLLFQGLDISPIAQQPESGPSLAASFTPQPAPPAVHAPYHPKDDGFILCKNILRLRANNYLITFQTALRLEVITGEYRNVSGMQKQPG